MKKYLNIKNKSLLNLLVNILPSLMWLTLLSGTDSFYVIYAMIAVICLTVKKEVNNNTFTKIITIIFAALLSFFVTISNYNLFLNENVAAFAALRLLTLFVSGIFVFNNLVNTANYYVLKADFFKNDSKSGNKVFLLTFLAIMIADVLVLVLCRYPGVLTQDSIKQVAQIESGIYTNHHPYWHTLFIEFFYKMGKSIFKSANAGVALYSLAQIIVMALIEAYANKTLYDYGTKPVINILFAASFIILPYHLFFSFTMWKDILFGGFVLLFATTLFRIYKSIGNSKLNLILLFIGSMGFCLFRSNGWLAFVASFALYVIMLFKKHKLSLLVMAFAIVLSFFMQHNLIASLNIAPSDLIESLSIPAQQIARVVVDKNDLNPDQYEMLSKVIEVERIPEKYQSFLSDNVKDLVRAKGRQDYLKEHMSEYAKLYIELGLSHPLEYIKAWIDETKGFYNGGYQEMIWSNVVLPNTFNISSAPLIPIFSTLATVYGWAFMHISLLQPFISSGLHVWIIMWLFYLSITHKNKTIFMLSAPHIMIFGTLMLATPLYCDLRYIYALFTNVFFLFVITVKEIKNEKE